MKFLNEIDCGENKVVRPAWIIKTITENYSIDTSTDEFIFCNATSGNISVTLPSAINIAGTGFTIKKIDSSSNPISVLPILSQTIDGNDSQVIRNKNALKLVSDGNNWFVV